MSMVMLRQMARVWPSEGNHGYIGFMSDAEGGPGEWVLLTYRLPREPSAPRLALWRKLKRLGVAQLSDGLVGLPADARTREQLEWAAEEVEAAGGTAGVWSARPATRAQERVVIEPMDAARAVEYAEVVAEATAARALEEHERVQALRRLRAQMRRIERRDFFHPPGREQARQALADLTGSAAPAEVAP